MGIFKRNHPSHSEMRHEEKMSKYDMKAHKSDNKLEDHINKYDSKNYVSDNKAQEDIAAYQNGINPKAPMWGAVSSLGQSAASAITGGKSGGGTGVGGDGSFMSSFGLGGGSTPTILAAAFLLFVMMSGKKRKR
jgi:hypothetical protein